MAAFMELALYDPEFGYYARSSQRSGRAGDFFTSVDVGPIFGELVEIQLEEMYSTLQASDFKLQTFDLVEAGAGNGRWSADILRAARREHHEFYDAIRLHLVEASAAARAEQPTTLGDLAERLAASSPSLPESFEGVLIANELLDAMPAHQVVRREDGLREVYVSHQSSVRSRQSGPAIDDCRLTTVEGPPSTPRLEEYLARLGVVLDVGWCGEINLNAIDWIRDAARRLRRGFMILIDYGHEARDLYSASHSAGTLTTFSGHRTGDGPPYDARRSVPDWLQRPGEQDITAHVDFTSVREAAEAGGMETLGFLDQTYFLMGILNRSARLSTDRATGALKTLMLPGGLGSTHKVLLLGKNVGRPSLLGTSFRVRVT